MVQQTAAGVDKEAYHDPSKHNPYSKKGVYNHAYLSKLIRNQRSVENDPDAVDAVKVRKEQMKTYQRIFERKKHEYLSATPPPEVRNSEKSWSRTLRSTSKTIDVQKHGSTSAKNIQ